MRFNTIRTTAVCGTLAGLLAAGVLTGCANKTEGERTLERAAEVEQAGNMITRGEKMVQDGAALEARGRTAREQGNTVEGNRLVNEGEAMQRQGRGLIEQGRKAKS